MEKVNLQTSESQPQTRIEIHRETFVKNDRRGELIRIEQLEPAEIAIVNSSFLEKCRDGQVVDIEQIYQAYAQTLHLWGIMCPHPQSQRLYEGWFKTDAPVRFEESRWFDCKLCGAAVINR